jgi:hypothetical protein
MRYPSVVLVAIVWCVSAALTGCSVSGTGSAASSDPAPSVCPLPPAGENAILLDLVLADAACRANVPDTEVVIKVMSPVTWSDGSLGCPQPGMSYSQAEVRGWQATVVAGDTTFDYRIRGPGQYEICESQ